MFETIMMMFKLTWRKWRTLWHVYVCRFSQGITKIPSREIYDFDVILFQIYKGIGEPKIILIYGGLAKLLQKKYRAVFLPHSVVCHTRDSA